MLSYELGGLDRVDGCIMVSFIIVSFVVCVVLGCDTFVRSGVPERDPSPQILSGLGDSSSGFWEGGF